MDLQWDYKKWTLNVKVSRFEKYHPAIGIFKNMGCYNLA